jgi:hypothetical protein
MRTRTRRPTAPATKETTGKPGTTSTRTSSQKTEDDDEIAMSQTGDDEAAQIGPSGDGRRGYLENHRSDLKK